jgi:hypothetical protein
MSYLFYASNGLILRGTPSKDKSDEKQIAQAGCFSGMIIKMFGTYTK